MRLRQILPYVVIPCWTVLLYFSTLGNPFVYDDTPQIVRNPHLSSPTESLIYFREPAIFDEITQWHHQQQADAITGQWQRSEQANLLPRHPKVGGGEVRNRLDEIEICYQHAASDCEQGNQPRWKGG